MAKRFNLLVGVVATKENEILLLQRSFEEKFMPGAWGIPAGKIDFGEDLIDAALRELYEESGLRGTDARPIGTSKFMSTKGDDELHNLQVNYQMTVSSKDVKLDHSSADYAWAPIHTIEKFNLDSFTISTIRQAFPSDGN